MVYIVYDLDHWQRNTLNNFTLKHCLSDVTNIVKSSDKITYVFGDYGIAFDGEGSWSFGNDFARNAGIFAVDNNSSSSHANNYKNNLIVLEEGPVDDIDGSVGTVEKNL